MDVVLGPEPLLPEAPFTVQLCIIGAHDTRQVMILQTDLPRIPEAQESVHLYTFNLHILHRHELENIPTKICTTSCSVE